MEKAILDRNVNLARRAAARGSVEATECYLESVRGYLPSSQYDQILREACGVGLKRVYFDAQRGAMDGDFNLALDYFDSAWKYSTHTGVRLDFRDITALHQLAYESDASLFQKARFTLKIISQSVKRVVHRG